MIIVRYFIHGNLHAERNFEHFSQPQKGDIVQTVDKYGITKEYYINAIDEVINLEEAENAPQTIHIYLETKLNE